MIPEKVIVTATGEFRAGVAVRLKFGMSVKNDYYYTVFLNGEGRTEVGKVDLLKSFDETRNLFLMDYKDPREFFNGEIEARLLSKEEIEGAIRAYDKFKGHHAYPPDYLNKLKAALTINLENKCAVAVKKITD